MALFRKSKTTTTNIPELQEYYANQQKESTGKAWLLAVGSLLITIVILVGAFFGGRWVYRKVTKKSKATVATTSQADTTSTTSPQTNKTTTPSTTPTSTPAATTTPAQGVAATQTPATNTSATAASTTQVPDTGPGDTISLFVAVMVVSYLLHRSYLARKLSK